MKATDGGIAVAMADQGRGRILHVDLTRGTLEVETDGGGDLFATLTALGAEGLIEEVRPLDDDLEAVFAYLVDDGLLSRWRRERDREARA